MTVVRPAWHRHRRFATRALGLSLGDRCCLALAQEHRGAQVVTADRLWKDLKNFKITLIR
jgi:PIN domain nuclease of toxin-antitoxin system